MKYITTERLGWILAAEALTTWSLHFYKQFERPAVGLFEGSFGGWRVAAQRRYCHHNRDYAEESNWCPQILRRGLGSLLIDSLG